MAHSLSPVYRSVTTKKAHLSVTHGPKFVNGQWAANCLIINRSSIFPLTSSSLALFILKGAMASGCLRTKKRCFGTQAAYAKETAASAAREAV